MPTATCAIDELKVALIQISTYLFNLFHVLYYVLFVEGCRDVPSMNRVRTSDLKTEEIWCFQTKYLSLFNLTEFVIGGNWDKEAGVVSLIFNLWTRIIWQRIKKKEKWKINEEQGRRFFLFVKKMKMLCFRYDFVLLCDHQWRNWASNFVSKNDNQALIVALIHVVVYVLERERFRERERIFLYCIHLIINTMQSTSVI